MAKKRKQKKTIAAGYIEKISSQISDIIKKDFEKSFKIAPSEIKKIKKMLPGLKKRLQKKIKEELKKSFRITPVKKTKKGKRKK
jgi:hypothetical protein